MNVKEYMKILVACILFSVLAPVVTLSLVSDSVVFTNRTESSFLNSLSPEEREAYKAENAMKLNWLEEVAVILTRVNPWPYYLGLFLVTFPITLFFYKRKSRRPSS